MLKRINYIKVIKIAAGSAAAILIANALGLLYAVSAGVITLLSLQDTKRATLFVAMIRAIAFVLTVVIALSVFSLLSYNAIAYGVYLLIFVSISYYFRLNDAIAMNAVLATHYLLEKNMSVGMIVNEALLLLIGAGIGIILNLYIPSNVKLIRNKQHIIEQDLKEILATLAAKLGAGELPENEASNLNLQIRKDCDGSCLQALKEHIDIGLEHAYTNMNNALFSETRYYIEYMEMRRQQYKILANAFEKTAGLTMVTPQAHEVASFIMEIVNTLAETENAKSLLASEDRLLARFKESSLPATREEFENRAVLYLILMDIRMFLKLKEDFADSLTKEQKEKYWTKIS
jgi:uncharacterized membrane protein YgaE (UPF0421/DUF939 family)